MYTLKADTLIKLATEKNIKYSDVKIFCSYILFIELFAIKEPAYAGYIYYSDQSKNIKCLFSVIWGDIKVSC